MKTVRALLSVAPGGPETLRMGTLPVRAPGPGEVSVSVHACGVNYFDYLLIQDQHHTIPERPFAPGGEFAGVVSALGEGVDPSWLGQPVVVGSLPFGAMAEEFVIGVEFCNPIPQGMSFEVAAGYALTYGTAYYGLRDCAEIQPGETLLVLGAAGGVGLATVELGRALGARVIAAASSPDKLAIAMEHGAHDGVVYPRGPFDRAGEKALADLFKQACGPRGADVVCDPVGGAYSEAAVRALRPDGRSLIIGFPAGIPRLPLNLVLLKGCRIMGVFWGPWVWRAPMQSRKNMDDMARLFEQGKIHPHISRTFAFEEGGQAIAWLGDRQAVGKVVVRIR